MKFIHPTDDSLIAARNTLLQESLRDKEPPYPIGDEYPIVLSPHNAHLSYCLLKENRIASHANLWPRQLYDKSSDQHYSVGLVGNVATSRNLRKQGLAKIMMDHLYQEAIRLNLDALYLWSDLFEFYQKLGYESVGRELRFYFNKESFSKGTQNIEKIKFRHISHLHERTYSSLLELRPETNATLERSLGEFNELLKIPDLLCFITGSDFSPQGYFITGKGQDMNGVIHEWGCSDPQIMLGAIHFLFDLSGWNEIILLAPTLPKTSIEFFSVSSTHIDEHPMAFGKIISSHLTPQLLKDPFIWGMDSI